jgi:tape measure domain-containing protein
VSVVANVAINVDSRGAVSNLRSVQNQAQSTEKAFSGVTSAASKLAIAFGGIQAAKFIFVKTAELESQTRSLQVLAGSAEKAGKIIKDLQKLGAVTPFTSTELIDSAKRLQAFGVQTEKVVEVTRRLADASGATGAELSGLVTAYGQVQVKGRLQGEELLQFQERGIALQEELRKMYGMTGEEFQKALSKGQVSAEAVEVAFIRLTQAGGKYAGGAIAQSDTLAGLMSTLQDSVDELARQFGGALSQSVKDVTKSLIGFVNGIASIPQPVMNAAGELAKLIIQLLLVEKAIKAIIGLNAAFVAAQVAMAGATATTGAAATTSAGAFALYTNNTRALQAQAAAATPVLNGLLGTLGRLAAIGAIAIVVNVAVTGMAAVYQAQAEIDRLRGVRSKGGAAAAFSGSATAEQKKEQQAVLAAIKKERESAGFRGQQAAAAAGVGKTMARQRADQLAEREASARAILALPTRGQATPTVSTVPTVGGGGGGRAGGGGSSKAANDAKRAADEALRESQRVADVVRDQQFITKQKGIQTKFAQLIFEAEQNADPIRVRQLQTVEALVLAGNETARLLEEEKNSVAQLAIARTRQGEAEAIRQQGLQDVLKLQIEQKKNFDEIIAGLDLELALKSATTEQAREQLRLAYELAKLQGQGFTDEQIGAITARKTELARPKTDRERLQGAAAGVKAELDALTDPINMITTAAAGIGDAFSTSFKGVISGSMTAKEALASFFTSVADMFLDMAAQIIAKMIQMAILNTIVSLLPGGSSGSSGSSMFKPGAPAQMVPSLPSATNYSGAFKARANGGPVSSGQTYMVGERGPELFVPGRSGTIVANDKMGGGNTNVVVNVDAKGSSVEGDEQGANQLGRVISAAVQSELIKQQRPGGILAR